MVKVMGRGRVQSDGRGHGQSDGRGRGESDGKGVWSKYMYACRAFSENK